MPALICKLAGAALAVYAVSLCFTSNFNLGVLLVWLLAAGVCVYGWCWRPLHRWFSTPVGRVALWALAAVGVVYAALLVFVAVSGYADPPSGDERVVVVLGAGLRNGRPSRLLRYRLDAAYDYAMAHPDALVVTSGGRGRDEPVAEGAAMRDYLLEKGLPAERVEAESASVSTEENFLFTRQLLERRGISAQEPIVYVSNAFHCYRAGQYARMAGFAHPRALPAGIPLRSVLPCYLREALAVLYYWVFRRVRGGPLQAFVGLMSLQKHFFYR